MTRVRSAEILEGFVVRLALTDGTQREVDLEPFFHGPIFDDIRRDHDAFCALRVDDRMGTIVWPNGADVDPDVLLRGLTPEWMDKAASQPDNGPGQQAARPREQAS